MHNADRLVRSYGELEEEFYRLLLQLLSYGTVLAVERQT